MKKLSKSVYLRLVDSSVKSQMLIKKFK